MENHTSNLGDRIKIVRKSLGMTMEEFGKQFSPTADKSNVSRWEKNIATPSNERLKKIATLGSMTVDELLYGKSLTPDSLRNLLIHSPSKIENELYQSIDNFIESIINSNDIFYENMAHEDYIYFEKLFGRLIFYKAAELSYKECLDSFIDKNSLTDIDIQIRKEARKIITKQLADNFYQSLIFAINSEPEQLDIIMLTINLLENNCSTGYIFIRYLILYCEEMAKNNSNLIAFILNRKVRFLQNEINSFLEKPSENVLKVEKNGMFEEKFIIDTIDYDIYVEINKRINELSSFISNSLER